MGSVMCKNNRLINIFLLAVMYGVLALTASAYVVCQEDYPATSLRCQPHHFPTLSFRGIGLELKAYPFWSLL